MHSSHFRHGDGPHTTLEHNHNIQDRDLRPTSVPRGATVDDDDEDGRTRPERTWDYLDHYATSELRTDTAEVFHRKVG